MKQASRIVALGVLALSTTAALAQIAASPAPARPTGSIAGHPGWPVAKPEDVKSPEAILDAVYNVISGAKGQQRDWDRMRSLFIPDARLIPAVAAGAGHSDAIVLTVDGYIERSGARLTSDGFFEHSVHNVMEQFGNIVEVWSTYESRHSPEDAQPFARGINSFQLLK